MDRARGLCTLGTATKGKMPVPGSGTMETKKSMVVTPVANSTRLDLAIIAGRKRLGMSGMASAANGRFQTNVSCSVALAFVQGRVSSDTAIAG